MDACSIGCGIDWGLIALAIGGILLGLLALLSIAMNIGGILVFLRRFKVSLNIQLKSDEDKQVKAADHSALALWLFGVFIAVLALGFVAILINSW